MSGARFAFLDRDGTLVLDRGYVHRIDDYERLPGAVEGLRLLAGAGFRLAIVSNQSGIGRGLYGVEEFRAFQAHLERDFAAHGVRFEAVYFCPHLPDAGCVCRKPKPGLLERARRELGADLASSVVIGDSPGDAGLARAAGCRAICVLTGKDAATLREALAPEVPVAADLEAAAHIALTPPS
jgi:histidinol-phosphate phosphatase family protein